MSASEKKILTWVIVAFVVYYVYTNYIATGSTSATQTS